MGRIGPEKQPRCAAVLAPSRNVPCWPDGGAAEDEKTIDARVDRLVAAAASGATAARVAL